MRTLKTLGMLWLLSTASLAQRLETRTVEPYSLVTIELQTDGTYGYGIFTIKPDLFNFKSVIAKDNNQYIFFSSGRPGGKFVLVCNKNNFERGIPDNVKFVINVSGTPDPDDPDEPDNPVIPPRPIPDPTLPKIAQLIQLEGTKIKFPKDLAKQIGGVYEGVASKIAAVSTMTGGQAQLELNTKLRQYAGQFPTSSKNLFTIIKKDFESRGRNRMNWTREGFKLVCEEVAKGFKAL